MVFTDTAPDNFPSRILRLPDVLQLVGLSKSSVEFRRNLTHLAQ